MPDRDYYLDKSDRMKQTRAAYVAHLEKMFTLAGEPTGSARARALLDFETKIATVHWTRIDSRDATTLYNKMLVSEIQKLAPGFDLATYIKGLGANTPDVLVSHPIAFTGLEYARVCSKT